MWSASVLKWALLPCYCEILVCWALSGMESTAGTADPQGAAWTPMGQTDITHVCFVLEELVSTIWSWLIRRTLFHVKKHFCYLSLPIKFSPIPCIPSKPQPLALGLLPLWGCQGARTSLTHHQTTQRSGAVILSRPWAFGNTDLEFGNVNNLYCMLFKTVFLCHE